MQALPRLRRRDADTTSYVADYLTRSVRRASGFVLADNPSRIVGSSATRYAGIKEMAAIEEGGHMNRAVCVAYIFIGVA